MAENTGKIARPGEYGDELAQQAMAGLEEEGGKTEKPEEKEEDLEPIEHWRKALKLAGITEEQAGTILDSMLSKGYWEREYRLYNGRVLVKLRTRDAQNINRVMATIDMMRSPTIAVANEVIAMMNLAGSLVQLRETTLPHPGEKATSDEIEEAFDKRRAFVNRIPGPLMGAIRGALVHFDTTVSAALANGAIEGF